LPTAPTLQATLPELKARGMTAPNFVKLREFLKSRELMVRKKPLRHEAFWVNRANCGHSTLWHGSSIRWSDL